VKYVRMPIEVESPEEFGYDRIKFNLSESSVRDRSLADPLPVTARRRPEPTRDAADPPPGHPVESRAERIYPMPRASAYQAACTV